MCILKLAILLVSKASHFEGFSLAETLGGLIKIHCFCCNKLSMCLNPQSAMIAQLFGSESKYLLCSTINASVVRPQYPSDL